MSSPDEVLAEHVIDRDGLVWRVVRDGGMATRAHYAGIVSIGIVALDAEHGPIVNLAQYVARARRDERETRAAAVEARYLGPDSGRQHDGREAPDALQREAYDEGLHTAVLIIRGEL